MLRVVVDIVEKGLDDWAHIFSDKNFSKQKHNTFSYKDLLQNVYVCEIDHGGGFVWTSIKQLRTMKDVIADTIQVRAW